MRVLTCFDDRDPVAWANGAGETTELVSLTGSAALTPWLRPWRLSIARLERPSPFSALPGMARTFLPTVEVVLSIDGDVHRVRPDRSIRFHGSQHVRLVELAETCFAVNLMVAEEGSDDASGCGGDSGLGELEMSVGEPVPMTGDRFVLTLEASAEHPRFQLLELDPDESVPDRISAAVLHAAGDDTHI